MLRLTIPGAPRTKKTTGRSCAQGVASRPCSHPSNGAHGTTRYRPAPQRARFRHGTIALPGELPPIFYRDANAGCCRLLPGLADVQKAGVVTKRCLYHNLGRFPVAQGRDKSPASKSNLPEQRTARANFEGPDYRRSWHRSRMVKLTAHEKEDRARQAPPSERRTRRSGAIRNPP